MKLINIKKNIEVSKCEILKLNNNYTYNLISHISYQEYIKIYNIEGVSAYIIGQNFFSVIIIKKLFFLFKINLKSLILEW